MYSLVSGVGPPTRDAATGVELRLTAAGRVWLDCNPEELKEADRRARMDKNRPTSMVFNAPVQGVHTGDNYGAISYTQVNRSDGEVLKALQTLLQSDTLWLQPDLESARTVVETAVSAGSVNDPNLRPALAKVLAVGGSLVLAVTGNSVYDVLKHFVTQ